VCHRDQLPVAISGWKFDSEDRSGLLIRAPGCRGPRRDNASKGYNCKQQRDSFHRYILPSFRIKDIFSKIARSKFGVELLRAVNICDWDDGYLELHVYSVGVAY
jgi:hypothetical protein